jgi:hypothetical protein
MNQIERSFARLRTKPCWGVSRGFGSFLTLEFGPPRLLTWRADRKYAYGQDNRLPHRLRWRSLGGEEAASDSRK